MKSVTSRRRLSLAAAIAFALLAAAATTYLSCRALDRALIQSVRQTVLQTKHIVVKPNHYRIGTGSPNAQEINEPFEVRSDDLGRRLAEAIDVERTHYLGSSVLKAAGPAVIECELADGTKYTFTVFSDDFIVVSSFRGPVILQLRNKKAIDDLFLEHAKVKRGPF